MKYGSISGGAFLGAYCAHRTIQAELSACCDGQPLLIRDGFRSVELERGNRALTAGMRPGA